MLSLSVKCTPDFVNIRLKDSDLIENAFYRLFRFFRGKLLG